MDFWVLICDVLSELESKTGLFINLFYININININNIIHIIYIIHITYIIYIIYIAYVTNKTSMRMSLLHHHQ